ncbi:hypothetical protein PS2_010170 [Malus domestica]
MGFQDIVGGRLGCNYEKLAKSNEKVGRPERQQWVKKMNGRPKGFRLSRSWKLTLKIFSVVVWTSRITRICSDIVNRMKVDVAYPTIIFSSQRGLPVLFHPSVRSCSIKYCSPKLYQLGTVSNSMMPSLFMLLYIFVSVYMTFFSYLAQNRGIDLIRFI